MKTFQDLQAIGENEQARMKFCWQVILEHLATNEVIEADINQQYYNGMNVTITQADRYITDILGKKVPDVYRANHKLKCHLYPYFINQQVLYLLGNGISFSNTSTLKKLGRHFEKRIIDLAIDTLNAGRGFGFWNYDHIEIFSLQEFAPLYDEDTGRLMAGVRFWQLADDKPLRIILFEPDGYTEYIKTANENITVAVEKRPYIQRVSTSLTGTEIAPGENYPGLPVIPMNTHNGKSAMYGHRESIDAYDLIASRLTNNIDNFELAYWIIKGAPALADDPEALNELFQRITVQKFVAVGEGQDIDEHHVEIPFEATQTGLDFMKKQLFTDFMAFDPVGVAGGSDTATQIKAAYEPLNEKTDLFESQVTEFIEDLLEIAGIDDVPTYTRSMIVNKQEEAQIVISAADWTDEEYTTRKLLEILGDADKADEIIKRRDAEDMDKFRVPMEEPITTEPTEGEEVG